MSERFESKKSGVFMAPKFPVMPVILMIFALIFRAVPLVVNIRYNSFVIYLYFIAMLLMFAGMVLHKLKMQILTGIGTLILAAYNTYTIINDVYYLASGWANVWTVCELFTSLLATAAFTVTGLHYVLRRPKPGKSAKLILMIPLTCLMLIYMIHTLGYYNPVFVLMNWLSSLVMYFALMIYTPFREG